MRRGARLGLAALLLAGPAMATAPAPPLTARAELGRTLFFDPRLSASGRLACAGCHDPAHAYAPNNHRAVQLGGPQLKTPGTRAVPSLRYKYYTRAYSDLYENPDQISPPAPGGGLTWDGRADTMAQQAEIPLLAANEMANADRASLAVKLKKLYARALRTVFGEAALSDPVAYAGKALQAFQREDRSFRPFSSRFDKYRNNKLGGTLTPQELRGFALYMASDKGNCNACHLLGAGNNGSQDISSDYSYAAIGVPRNLEIPANADPAYYDLGLCGPLRHDHAPTTPSAPDLYCGQFKAPVLRNVATRGVFMHNGYFKSLREVLRFYAMRDVQPQRWYPKDTLGQVRKFDDLPEVYRGNVDRQAPLDLRTAGSAPALNEADIDDLLAFLKTLSDEDVKEIAEKP